MIFLAMTNLEVMCLPFTIVIARIDAIHDSFYRAYDTLQTI